MTPQPLGGGSRADGAACRLLRRFIDLRPDEVRALAWSWLYIFSVRSVYYTIRPIRDDMGIASGVETLPWLFTGTLLGMMMNPPFAALVARLPRVRSISVAYRFFIANLLLFFLLLEVAVLSVRRLSHLSEALRLRPAARREEAPIGRRAPRSLRRSISWSTSSRWGSSSS